MRYVIVTVDNAVTGDPVDYVLIVDTTTNTAVCRAASTSTAAPIRDALNASVEE